ncbi:MAG TPA: methyltransferase domain-containing protein [Candidatus Saccharimonadales bacterium]|nr:methyltransferase domain-containing protein [Candidatus Saccharimonadales bacterium]
MSIFWLIATVLVLTFGFVVIFGPPYLPTRRQQIEAALDLLALKPGQTMLDLGAGDGRVMRAAAQRGWRVVGVELNPLLVLIAKLSTWRYRKQVRVIWGDYFRVTWPPANGIFTFMIGRQMAQLDKYIKAWPHKPVKLASFAFTVPGKKPAAQRKGIFLYEYN